uniref:Uncharacterized protein n=1 Tax=Anguilla anguilla TaxID=7936 RepID=A0A0E9XV29_ANGAN
MCGIYLVSSVLTSSESGLDNMAHSQRKCQPP